MSTLAAAIELARANIPVFPVILTDDNKKVPVIQNWRNAATTDVDTVRQWFTNTSVPDRRAHRRALRLRCARYRSAQWR